MKVKTACLEIGSVFLKLCWSEQTDTQTEKLAIYFFLKDRNLKYQR